MGNFCGNFQDKTNFLNKDYLQEATKILKQKLKIQQQGIQSEKIKFFIAIVAKILVYEHENLILHLQNQQQKNKIIEFIKKWSNINFQQIDMIKQNFLKIKLNENKRINYQMTPKLIKKQQYQKMEDVFDHYVKKGIQLYQQQKIAITLFLSEIEQFSKSQFIQICNKLKNESQSYKILYIIIITDKFNYVKVKEVIKLTNFDQQKINIKISLKKLQPVLNQKGQITLKNSNSFQYLQLPVGNFQFMSFSVQGITIQQFLKQNNIQYIICIQSQIYKNNLIDQFFLGYLQQNYQSFDILYKCSQVNNRISNVKYLYENKGELKIQQYVENKINQSPKHKIKQENNLNMNVSFHQKQNKKYLIWQGYFAFNLNKYKKFQNTYSQADLRQFIQLKQIYMPCWDPLFKKYIQSQKIHVFYQPLTNFLNKKGIMAMGLY